VVAMRPPPLTDDTIRDAVAEALSDLGGPEYVSPDYGPIADWDVSGVTSMLRIFNGATLFHGELSVWDVSSVTDMFRMFNGATEFNGDLSGWDVHNVTDMALMFAGATAFNCDLSGWDVRNVTSKGQMFAGAVSYRPEHALGSRMQALASYNGPMVRVDHSHRLVQPLREMSTGTGWDTAVHQAGRTSATVGMQVTAVKGFNGLCWQHYAACNRAVDSKDFSKINTLLRRDSTVQHGTITKVYPDDGGIVGVTFKGPYPRMVNIMYTCDLWQGHRPQNDLDFTKHVLAFKHGDIWAMANNFW